MQRKRHERPRRNVARLTDTTRFFSNPNYRNTAAFIN
jgi:hypothetical protein